MSVTLGQLGMIHEFGTEHIPARPFLEPAMYRNRSVLSALNRSLLLKIIHGEMTKREGLGELGARGEFLVKEQIRETWLPMLKEATIKAKGSSHPLIDFGQMQQNVQWEYEE
jgi:hypothetical protein